MSVSVAQTGSEAPPSPDQAPSARGWQAGLAAMGGSLHSDEWPTLPSPLSDHAAARNVFDRAGQNGVIKCADGSAFAAYGFPDLLRPSSKVLITANGGRGDFVLALHRYPQRVGILGHGAPSLLPSPQTPLATEAKARSIQNPPQPHGNLFAVDTPTLYQEQDGQIWSWDGNNTSEEGHPKQVGASLVLKWSQR